METPESTSKFICPHVYHSLTIQPNGYVKPCCELRTDHEIGDRISKNDKFNDPIEVTKSDESLRSNSFNSETDFAFKTVSPCAPLNVFVSCLSSCVLSVRNTNL